MALTSAELVSVRRFAGYPLGGDAPVDLLATVLLGMTADEEAVLRTVYLTPLARLEVAIPNASDTLNTESAAVWKRNPVELGERMGLFRALRMAMCRYLGIPPGPGINDPVMIVPVPGEDPQVPVSGVTNAVPAILVV